MRLQFLFLVVCAYFWRQHKKAVENEGIDISTITVSPQSLDEYKRSLEHLDKLTDKNAEWQDKFILTISSALFGLLFANFSKLPDNMLFVVLVVNNGLTLMGTLLSYSFAICGILRKKSFAMQYYIYGRFEYRNKENLCGKVAEYCSLLSIITTCLTILFLVIMLILQK